MKTTIHWLLELTIKEGEFETFKTLMNDMVAATNANEPDTTHYEWFVSKDKNVCHIYERYVDSDAAMTHLDYFR